MNEFYKVDTKADELQYLKRINDLNRNLQTKYKNEFFDNHTVQMQNEKTFLPITIPLKESLKERMISQPSYQSPPQARGKPKINAILQLSKLKTAKRAGKRKLKRFAKVTDREPEEEEEITEPEFDVNRFLRNPSGDLDQYFGILKTRNNKYTLLGKTVRLFQDKIVITSPRNLRHHSINIPSYRIWMLILLKDIPFTPTDEELRIYADVLSTLDFRSYISQIPKATRGQMLKSNKYQ